jgi:hypothetical protein
MPLCSNSKILWQIRSALYAASLYAGQSRDKKSTKREFSTEPGLFCLYFKFSIASSVVIKTGKSAGHVHYIKYAFHIITQTAKAISLPFLSVSPRPGKNVHDLRLLRLLFHGQEVSISLPFVIEAIHEFAHEMDSESTYGPFLQRFRGVSLRRC